ncbi:MAG: hypothetical protein ACF8R9_10135 [Phycisphaerales bacterium JB054]
MALIYCGIDEAGYGPMLGPLCVGFSAFRVEDWTPEGGAPDLWKLLDKAVCRKGRDSRGRIAVADSKKLKLSNQSKTRHPLTHLERGVLAFGGLACQKSPLREQGDRVGGEASDDRDPSLAGGAPSDAPSLARGALPAEHTGLDLTTDHALFCALGAHLEPHPWYGGEAVGLPLEGSEAQLAIARNTLALTCERAGVEPLALACIAVGESEFNEAVRTGGSKAHLTTRCFARYLRRVVERWGDGGDEVRVVCDRHGGRTSYASMIEMAVRGLGCGVETLEESERCSRYLIERDPSLARGGLHRGSPCVHVQFRPEAEEAHLPVALASMTAKLVRELSMARFNRYWCARMPELKPTAGYVQDARRWLEDLDGVMYDDEREAMVRLA